MWKGDQEGESFGIRQELGRKFYLWKLAHGDPTVPGNYAAFGATSRERKSVLGDEEGELHEHL